MFWDNVAGVYDVFVKVVNAKTHIPPFKDTIDQQIALEACKLHFDCFFFHIENLRFFGVFILPKKRRQVECVGYSFSVRSQYIQTPSPDRCIGEFGENYPWIRYVWNGDDNALSALAQRLSDTYGPDDVTGREHNALDLVAETMESFAEFELR